MNIQAGNKIDCKIYVIPLFEKLGKEIAEIIRLLIVILLPFP